MDPDVPLTDGVSVWARPEVMTFMEEVLYYSDDYGPNGPMNRVYDSSGHMDVIAADELFTRIVDMWIERTFNRGKHGTPTVFGYFPELGRSLRIEERDGPVAIAYVEGLLAVAADRMMQELGRLVSRLVRRHARVLDNLRPVMTELNNQNGKYLKIAMEQGHREAKVVFWQDVWSNAVELFPTRQQIEQMDAANYAIDQDEHYCRSVLL